MSKPNYEFRCESSEAELWIYDVIGQDWFGDGVTATQIKDDLKKAGNVKSIVVHLNSPGGDVFDGVTIYNLLSANKARVTVEVEGLAASAASVIAMAGDDIRMAENAMLMIHNPWGMAVGEAEDMRKTADTLEKIGGSLVQTYASRTGQSESQIQEWMRDETWFSAAEAREFNFATDVIESKKAAAAFGKHPLLARYQHTPAAIVAAEAPETEPEPPATTEEPIMAEPTPQGPPVEPAPDPRNELKQYMTAFGDVNGAKWYAEAKPFEDCLALHTAAQDEQITALKAENADLRVKLDAAIKAAGESAPVSSKDGEPDQKAKGIKSAIRILGAKKQ